MMTLLRRLEHEPPIVVADEVMGPLQPSLKPLLTMDLLQETGHVDFTNCPDCSEGPLEVFILSNPTSGHSRGVATCPECGLFRVPLDRLRRWRVDVRRFLEMVFAPILADLRMTETIPGRLWRVGNAYWSSRMRDVFFCPRFNAEDVPTLHTVIGPRKTVVVLVPTGQGAMKWKDVHPVIPLTSVLSLSGSTFQLSVEGIEDYLGAEDRPPTPPKRGSRAAKIEALILEVTQHLRAARDHALHYLKTTGEPRLLKRPSQSELGRRTGMSRMDVSRCMQDPTAERLRQLWEMAKDLDVITYGTPD